MEFDSNTTTTSENPADAEAPVNEDGQGGPGDAAGPFPVSAIELNCPIAAQYISEWADSLECHPSYTATPLLAILAGCVGSTRRLFVKRGYEVPSLLWTMLCADSGSGKSHPLDEMKAILDELEDTANANASGGFPVVEEQPRIRYTMQKTTTEALAKVLSENPRGLIVARDELSGWLKDMNSYKKGGGDEQFYLELYKGKTRITVDTKGDGCLTASGTVSITGTIQPSVLARLMSPHLVESGLFPRILIAMPPYTVAGFNDHEVSDHAYSGMADLFRQLQGLAVDFDGNPGMLQLDDAAKGSFHAFSERLKQRMLALPDDEMGSGERSSLAKLRDTALRLALVLQLASSPTSNTVSHLAMRGAIEIAEWYKQQGEFVYDYVHRARRADDGGRGKKKTVVDYVREIQEAGHTPTARDLQRKMKIEAAGLQIALAEAIEKGQLFRLPKGRTHVYVTYVPSVDEFQNIQNDLKSS